MDTPIGFAQASKRKSDFISKFFGLLNQNGFDAAFAYAKDVYKESGGRFNALEIMNNKAIQNWAIQPANKQYLGKLREAVQNRAAIEVVNLLSKGGDAYDLLAKNQGALMDAKEVLKAVTSWAERQGRQGEIATLMLRFEPGLASNKPITKVLQLPHYEVTATQNGLFKGEISSDGVSKVTGKEGEGSIVAYGISESILEINLRAALANRIKGKPRDRG